MTLLRSVALMILVGAPLLLLVSRLAFGPFTRLRLLVALRSVLMGLGALLISFRASGATYHVAGLTLLTVSAFWPRFARPAAHSES